MLIKQEYSKKTAKAIIQTISKQSNTTHHQKFLSNNHTKSIRYGTHRYTTLTTRHIRIFTQLITIHIMISQKVFKIIQNRISKSNSPHIRKSNKPLKNFLSQLTIITRITSKPQVTIIKKKLRPSYFLRVYSKDLTLDLLIYSLDS